jgi:hypothetical protein
MMKKQLPTNAPQEIATFAIFKINRSKVNIDVLFQDETLWLTQKQLAELFEVNVPAVSKHLKNIFATEELDESRVVSKMEITATDGKKYKTNFYNLRVITAIGYRINSHRATQFRKWATEVLHEYIIKGFAMDDERLKSVHHFGKDYFDEQMGLKTWKNAPEGKILKSDVSIAKNYLNHEHIDQLNRIVSAYLDLAENRALQGIVMNMKDWIVFLDKFLALSDYPILLDNGKVSALEAKLKAETEYEKYRVIQDQSYVSDFDKLLLDLEKK